MGPPSINPSSYLSPNDARQQQAAAKQAPTRSFNYDMDDTLAGTGINLDEEEQFVNDMETREGFAAWAPGSRGSLFGAGPANQLPQATKSKTQAQLVAENADRAWNEAARQLAISRHQEFKDIFVQPSMLHSRMSKIATELGLTINEELRADKTISFRPANPANFAKPEIRVKVATAADGTVVRTEGSWIPKDAYLVDQIALLAIATKEHVSVLLADAHKVATTRQQSSHGEVPSEWLDAATSEPTASIATGAQQDSAVSPSTHPLKRKTTHSLASPNIIN